MADDIVLHHPEILELIPHRPPFLLIDRVQNITPMTLPQGSKPSPVPNRIWQAIFVHLSPGF